MSVARRFVVDRVVHAGEDAWVVAARDRLDDEAECALKIASGRDRLQGRAQRLEAEYRILADLRHPGIPRVVDFGSDAELDATYFALELILGTPLSQCDGLVPSHALVLFQEVLRTLAYLHDRQMLHCDVKPANLLRDERLGRTVLIDFDLARAIGGASGRGTAPYVAPEVLGLGGPVDARADLYSLAATFATLLGGAVPPANSSEQPELPDLDHPLVPVLRAMLARDPAARPANGREVLARLRALGCDAPDETRATARARILHPPYIPREGLEMRVLEEIPTARGRAGEKTVVALKGPLGAGKTRLVERLGTVWRASGVRVLDGRPGGGTLGPVRDVLRKLARLEDEADSEALAPGRSSERLGTFDRLGQRILRLGRSCRTVLVFEDVHRFDRPSREFLLHFFRQLSDETGAQEGAALRALVTYDSAELLDDPLRAWLDAEVDAGGVVIVPVDPLTEAESSRLVRELALPREVDPAAAASLVARGGGIPLLLRESVAAWLEDPGAAPASVEALIARRLDRLPADERAVFDLVALFPAGAARPVLASVLEPAPIDGPLASLLMRELVEEHLGRVFVPAQLRVQALGRVSDEAAAPVHAKVAAVLLARGATPDETAWHLLRAGDAAGGLRLAYDAVPALRDGGLEEEAIRLLSEVAARAGRHVGARRWAELTLCDLWIARGQTAKARAVLEGAGGPADPAVAVRRARVFSREGDRALVKQALAPVLALDREISPGDRAEILVELAEMLHALGHPADAREALDLAAPLFEADVPHGLLSNDDVPLEAVKPPRFAWPDERAGRVARYLTVRGDLERGQGRLVAALKCELGALKLASRFGDPQTVGRVSHAAGTVFMAAGRHDLAEPWFVRALPIRRDAGDLVGVADTANNLGVLLRKAKRSTEAIEQFTVSLRLRRQVGHLAGEGYAYLNIANVYYERRDLDAATRYYQRALAVARRLHDARSQAQVLNNLGAVAHLRSRIEEAIRAYEEAEALFRLVGDVHGAMARWLNLADLRIETGQLVPAARLLDVVARLNAPPRTRRRRREARPARERGGIARGARSPRRGPSCSPRRAGPISSPTLLEEMLIELAFTEVDGRAGMPPPSSSPGRSSRQPDRARRRRPSSRSIRGLVALRGGEDAARRRAPICSKRRGSRRTAA